MVFHQGTERGNRTEEVNNYVITSFQQWSVADVGFIHGFEPVMGEIQVPSQVKRKNYRGRNWLTGRILGR